MDGSSQHILNIASAAWVRYSPVGDLVSSSKICLGPVTKNIAKYHAMIGLTTNALLNGVSQVVVYLDSELVVS